MSSYFPVVPKLENSDTKRTKKIEQTNVEKDEKGTFDDDEIIIFYTQF